ncbi:hypothetical protein M885DRAFT_168255 [Pelagophyceae sp. CCMP2097]|nr:hypothetical protein M885DRAFT_168255 [Pelagophyceae sp. CCMP2097]
MEGLRSRPPASWLPARVCVCSEASTEGLRSRPPASWLPARVCVSVKIMPAAAAAARKAAGPHLAPRWQVPIMIALVVASGLCIASVIGVLQDEKDRRDADKAHKADCRNARERITEWGKRQAVEASTLGSVMVRERSLSVSPSTPFLVPGVLSNELQIDRLLRSAKEFEQTPASVLWSPTVRLEDRAAYEAWAGETYGAARPINITDLTGEIKDATFSVVAAAPRATYNPLSVVWTVADPGTTLTIEQAIGLDLQEYYRRNMPPAPEARFDDMRPLAQPLYFPEGNPLPDFAMVVLVKVVDETCQRGGDCFADDQAPVIGYVSFYLTVARWAFIFPANVKVIEASTGHVIKTADAVFGVHAKHSRAYEPYLDLDIKCYYDARHSYRPMLYLIGTIVLPLVVALLLWLLRRIGLGAARERAMIDELRRDAAHAAAAKEQRTSDAFQMSEKTERYLNHELKNRIFILGQSIVDKSLLGQIDEITEVLNNKAVLVRLSTGRYEPSWDAVDPTALIGRRWQRFVAADSPFERAETTGAAAHRTVLRFDKVLFNICLDNMLSNAFKYGDASKPPSLALRIDPLDDGATRVRLSLELRNWAGHEHAALLQLGEEELNEIARAEGRRAHEHAAELSAGDGFPMAAAAARALGGTVRLVLLPDGVIAKLELPDVAAELTVAARRSAAAAAAPVELSWLKIAMADDSAMFRKMIAMLTEKVTSRVPIVAGATRESIDGFPKMVIEGDVDVVFLDFNFAPVHHTKTGVDICRECRQLDAEEGNVPRLIFIVSANDSPEDAERYRAAGADGSLGKKLTPAKLRQVLEDAVRTHPRFAARRASDLVARAASWRCLQAMDTPPPSPWRPASGRLRPNRIALTPRTPR